MEHQVFEMPRPPAKAVVILGIVGGALLILASLLGVVAMGTHSIEVDDKSFTVNGSLYSDSVSRDVLQLDQARVVDLSKESALVPDLKTNGLGLPGHLEGWFTLEDDTKAFLMLTDESKVLYIPTTKDYSFLISAEEPEKLLAALTTTAP